MKSGGSLSIWFFIGLSLLVNGVLICGAGLYELAYPPQNRVVLYGLHASIWWGGLLAILGAIYCYRFSPARERARSALRT
jgi:putative copper export protein